MRTCAAVLCCLVVLGCTGDPGPAGETGATGPRGEQGERGPKGPFGMPGDDGADGTPGAMGAPGDPGERGPAGPRGEAGPPGAAVDGGTDGGSARAYEPRVWFSCVKLLDLLTGSTLAPDGLGETVLIYRATLYVGGDADLDCRIDGASNQSASSGGYYPMGTNAAANGSCGASLDYPPVPSGVNQVGLWHFTVPASGPRVTYEDADASHPLNGYVYEFVDADCTLLVDNGDGWSQRTLANLWP
jgi:hypothetical protein